MSGRERVYLSPHWVERLVTDGQHGFSGRLCGVYGSCTCDPNDPYSPERPALEDAPLSGIAVMDTGDVRAIHPIHDDGEVDTEGGGE